MTELTIASTRPPAVLPPDHLLAHLRCLECAGGVALAGLSDRPGYPELGADGYLSCERCEERYPILAGTPRMLPKEMRALLWRQYPRSVEALRQAGTPQPSEQSARPDIRQRTADSFAYEWERFGALRQEWRKNFIDYMQPHQPESFADRLVLDVGTGSGRHAHQAAEFGAQVVAVDIGRSIDVARGNLPPRVMTVQADAMRLPFAPAAFEFVMSIGVLHHLADPQAALQGLAPLIKPGGNLHVYLYWWPQARWQVRVLELVSQVRRITIRLPHRVLHAICVPLAALLAVAVVWPYRLARRVPRLRGLAAAFPLKTYADYPFGVLVNDQFDRFSAPLERRYRRAEVIAMLEASGLRDIHVVPNHGWVADGTV